MQDDIPGMDNFPPPKRHAYLDANSVRRLVQGVKAGLDHPANLEKTRNGWRLRVKFRRAGGGAIRRSITLPDQETAEWVAEYIETSRLEAAKRRLKEQVRKPIGHASLDRG